VDGEGSIMMNFIISALNQVFCCCTFHGLDPLARSNSELTSQTMNPFKRCPFPLTEHSAMKAYWGNGGIAPLTRDLRTRWRWVVSFTLRPLYPQTLQ